MDPVSLTASALAFIGAVKKITDSLGQVSDNRRKLMELKDDILRGLHDIQKLVARDNSDISAATQAEMSDDLDYLRIQLELVHNRCNTELERRSKGLISSVSSNIKSWTRYKAVEADIARLDKLIQASYIRFLVFTSVNTRRTAHRTEERVLHHLTEQQENILRSGTPFINVDVDCDPRRQSSPSGEIPASTIDPQDELNLLTRQARRIVEAFKVWKSATDMVVAPPSGHHDQKHPEPPRIWDVDLDSLFNSALIEAYHASSLLVFRSNSRGPPIQRSAKAVIFLSEHLHNLGFDDLAAPLFQCAITLYSTLYSGFPCPQYRRCLAFALFRGSRYDHPSQRLAYSERALGIYEALCAQSSDPHDFGGLAQALEAHSQNLMVNGLIDESLDIARQLLTLQRDFNTTVKNWSYCRELPVVTWSASGEADIVYSSDRQPILPSLLALNLSASLWNVARSLASLGRYSDARIAGTDAIECLTAVLQANTSKQRKGLPGCSVDQWRESLASWGLAGHRSPRFSAED
ncbi:hypothetical protein HGRIS_011449 [Hohenbuehelia grisea]|uniref:Fungal N-terminal domain-containing protein n=1 Tax=Hohenbuehelia grisea TaxID=104357 RepID=A0ABR3JV64_9AGAR